MNKIKTKLPLKSKLYVIGMLALCFLPGIAKAGVQEVIAESLRRHVGATRAEVITVLGTSSGKMLSRATSATILSENALGEARALVSGYVADGPTEEKVEYHVKYSAWVKGWTTTRRVSPGEVISAEVLELRDFNVAEGLAREYRGGILLLDHDLSRVEATQTLLPGSFIPVTGVRKSPDVRRGDAVTLELRAGGVRLTTSGVALEPSSFHQKVRVQSQKNKREFVGVLREGVRVEVTL